MENARKLKELYDKNRRMFFCVPAIRFADELRPHIIKVYGDAKEDIEWLFSEFERPLVLIAADSRWVYFFAGNVRSHYPAYGVPVLVLHNDNGEWSPVLWMRDYCEPKSLSL